MSKIGIPLEGFERLTREAAREGAVLLKNDDGMLPIGSEETLSVFGRCQIDYYRCGTGSGGAVNVPYTTSLLQGLRENGSAVNEELAAVYESWIAEHPFDDGGGGWAAEPWNQEEMIPDESLLEKARSVSEKAVIVIGRTAGEEQDNQDAPGSLRLTEQEIKLLTAVNARFDQIAILFNVSNVIDMGFMADPVLSGHVKALMYVWHGGMEGGRAAADLLLGRAVPCGKLPDTIARGIGDYPSTPYYGDTERNCYAEDIYVGYRYFETFAPEKVLYEFGYGLSYTDFEIRVLPTALSQQAHSVPEDSLSRNDAAHLIQSAGDSFTLTVAVRNRGLVYSGKEVVQVYYEAPQGQLGQPVRQLLAFQKTRLLAPGETQELSFTIAVSQMKSYDDSGLAGARSAYVMEAGDYHIYVGSSVRRNERVFTWHQDSLRVIGQLEEAAAPMQAFDRMRPGVMKADGTREMQYEPVPLKTVSLPDRIKAHLPMDIKQTGNRGIGLRAVKEGSASMQDFIAQLTGAELAMLVRGEGMDHPDVTPGTTSVFGSVGEPLIGYGIPLACTSDGPSGLRLGPGLQATLLPVGTLLAASFNVALVEELYAWEGKELVRNEVDLLLGPGMNIHRSPFNGRNFEYYSEDPLLTGKMGAAAVRGVSRGGACATIKHFACNNQETGRTRADAIVSERALREIYLRGFELAVKEGKAESVMTSYNPVNGFWSASNYDLDTTVLRKEWGFQGIVMTDWWAQVNDVEQGGPAGVRALHSMVRAGNDLYMIVNIYGAEINSGEDDLLESLENGTLTIGELQQSAERICRFLMDTKAMDRVRKAPEESMVLMPLGEGDVTEEMVLHAAGIDKIPIQVGQTACMKVTKAGAYFLHVHMMSVDFNTAQVSCDLYINGKQAVSIGTRGTEERWISQKLCRMELQPGYYSLRVEEVRPNLVVDEIWFEE